jgi:hypothetical protein
MVTTEGSKVMSERFNVHKMCSYVISKTVPVHNIKAYRGSSGTVPLILNFGARWR